VRELLVSVGTPVLRLIKSCIEEDHRTKSYRPVAVAIVENEEGNILLTQSVHGKDWGFPQGGVERGEDVVAGLTRELFEETGIRASEIHCFCWTERLDIPGRKRDGFINGKHYYYFHVACRGVPEVIRQKTEVRAYQWMTLPDAADIILKNESAKKDSMREALVAIRHPS
jgi:8-oxo-dGTP pyrophosphatase MutT (NUDIX family)